MDNLFLIFLAIALGICKYGDIKEYKQLEANKKYSKIVTKAARRGDEGRIIKILQEHDITTDTLQKAQQKALRFGHEDCASQIKAHITIVKEREARIKAQQEAARKAQEEKERKRSWFSWRTN